MTANKTANNVLMRCSSLFAQNLLPASVPGYIHEHEHASPKMGNDYRQMGGFSIDGGPGPDGDDSFLLLLRSRKGTAE